MKARSAALITAAIIVTAASSATAGSLITSAKIKDGTIQLKDLNKKARVALAGQRGPAGPPGASIARIDGAVLSAPPGASPTAMAACPGGQHVVGGGAIANPINNMSIGRSAPSPDNTQWVVNAVNSGGFAGDVEAIAYCSP